MMRPRDDAPGLPEFLPDLLAGERARIDRAKVTDALDAIDGAMNDNIRLTGDAMSAQQTDRERYGTDGWIDRAGYVWRIGDDGLLHTHETKPFPGAFVERKWGPLRKVKEMK